MNSSKSAGRSPMPDIPAFFSCKGYKTGMKAHTVNRFLQIAFVTLYLHDSRSGVFSGISNSEKGIVQ